VLPRSVTFFTLSHEHEPEEHFVDPAAARHDEVLATLPPLSPRRQARFRDQLELWRVAAPTVRRRKRQPAPAAG